MTDLTKLKELAERATPGPWYAVDYGCTEEGPWWFVDTTAGRADIFDDSGDPSPNHHDRARGERDMKFIAAANPQAILGLIERLDKAEHHWANENSNNMALIAEVERLRGCVQEWERSIGAKAYIDSVMLRDEVDRLKAENEALRSALQAVHAEVDGNLRPLTRDLVNMVSGVKNGSHPNDIYDHCDEIDRIIDAALEGGGS